MVFLVDRSRKQFSKKDHAAASKAFSFLQRDMGCQPTAYGHPYYPVLRKEDFGIDVAVYKNEAEYRIGSIPLFYIELEVKEKAAGWTPGHYPFPDIHFLARKAHLLYCNAVPFWVCYNHDGTDCVTVPMEIIQAFPLAQNSSIYHDLVYLLPIEACTFGCGNIVKTIESYYKGQLGISQACLTCYPDHKFGLVNRSYRRRFQYDQVRIQQQHLTEMQRKNDCPVGIRQFL